MNRLKWNAGKSMSLFAELNLPLQKWKTTTETVTMKLPILVRSSNFEEL